MTIGNRISELRKAHNYSQEYIAEQLGISRQAVSKWETDTTAPDTHNLIKLAQLLNTTVEYIAVGNVTETPQKKKRRIFTGKTVSALCAVFALTLIVSAVIFLHTRPVSWDSGACSGGFGTAVFDKYSDELVSRFAKADEGITDVTALRGTQQAEWDGRTIYLDFAVSYKDADGRETGQTLRFVGKWVWPMTYKWGGAIIKG